MSTLSHPIAFYAALVGALEDAAALHEALVERLCALRSSGGRLFVLGLGGGAANAAHAANDFRKLCGIEAYAPTDGIAEFTARANDEGWATVFEGWLRVSRFNLNDALLVFSVGGGTPEVSPGIYAAVAYAQLIGASVMGVVSEPGGVTAAVGDPVVFVRDAGVYRTPVTETVQLAVLHALVSDERLQEYRTKW